tara:strand:- start:131 stop:373 length:243 start_codon:yes stop_codon:yes gene_type:complete
MKKLLGIVVLGLLIGGCAPNTVGQTGNNENSVNVNVNIITKSKGPNHPPTLAQANAWCGQFNKTAKYLRSFYGGFTYTCN